MEVLSARSVFFKECVTITHIWINTIDVIEYWVYVDVDVDVLGIRASKMLKIVSE